jgi:hypothetical protein
MKISARGGGGFSGRIEHYQVDTERLENGPALEALLRNLDFFSAAPPSPVGADIARWEVTVDDGGRARTVAFAEDDSPGAQPWQSLIAHLRSTA